MAFRNQIARMLISICINYHIYITFNNQMQRRRFHMNATNNLHKYFGQDSPIFQVLQVFIRQITLLLLAFNSLMLVSRWSIWKIITIIGIVMYNILILHYHVIVPNYYALRDWIAIVAGIVYLMAYDWQQQENVQVSKQQVVQPQNKPNTKIQSQSIVNNQKKVSHKKGKSKRQ